MHTNQYRIDILEDMLWQYKKHCDEMARFFTAKQSDIEFAFDRVENQEYDPIEFQDTSESEEKLVQNNAK
jgi:hypothetical protein